MNQRIQTHQFDNGLALICETMGWLESAAVSLSVPAGSVRDPDHQLGLANLTTDMVQRGSGDLDSRAFAERLDRLGVDRGAVVSQAHTSFVGATLSESIQGLLQMFVDMLRRPQLPESQLEDSRQVCLQELASLEDDLAQRTMDRLRSLAYPAPWGRSAHGTVEHVESMTLQDVVNFHRRHFVPRGTILSVSGKVEFSRIRDIVGELLADWQGQLPDVQPQARSTKTYDHIEHDSNQTQIGIAYPSVPYSHEDYFQSRGAVGVLSDGMSSRLFTEVRENRGLCYTVYAGSHSLKQEGWVLCYAGTTTERAQETLDVMLAEITRLAAGIAQTELERLQARMKSALIMQQESSTARANALSGDWYYLGRIRTMDELNHIIDALSTESIGSYLKRMPPADFIVTTLGQQPLEVPLGIS